MALRCCGHLDRLLHAVSRGRVDLLAGLCNFGEDSLIRQIGNDLGGLVLQGNLVTVDA